ncbi:FecR family protein [Sinomicrobium oceani]|uniref:FecR family protein n=1 Tax=Sinomicrobium oceani TaxID=1150368 RepID=A0A1K1P1X1_9FLAO|nr:FecR family protein [Sinomicrobium oceani]SFW41475.1 FecR family protein [Sinomicrobium oceani]
MKREKLILLFKGLASEEDKKKILRWIRLSKANEDFFYRIKADYTASQFPVSSKEVNIDSEWKQFKKRSFHSTYNYKQIWPYAAVLLIMLSLGTGGYRILSDGQHKTKAPEISREAITLQLSNGNIKILDEEGSMYVQDTKGNIIGTQKGKQLIYTDSITSTGITETQYNTLTVPYAKTFDLTLSDGSRITLNSGTTIKYPSSFSTEGERKVFLKGEAYFRITKNPQHPFIVSSENINVRVLGTEFNLSSYPEDKKIHTALIEGSVSLYPNGENYDPNRAVLLQPGQVAMWDKALGSVHISETETDLYTSWIDGKIIFRHTVFENIVKKLERHYNVKIRNMNTEFQNKKFTASFDVETIQQVMETFRSGYELNYRIDGNTITIE